MVGAVAPVPPMRSVPAWQEVQSILPTTALKLASNGYGLAAATLGPISGPSTAPDVTAPVGRVGC